MNIQKLIKTLVKMDEQHLSVLDVVIMVDDIKITITDIDDVGNEVMIIGKLDETYGDNS